VTDIAELRYQPTLLDPETERAFEAAKRAAVDLANSAM
jgi:hypothetical protein